MKLAEQARLGRIVMAAFLTALLIPLLLSRLVLPQPLSVEGVFVRDNGRQFGRFLETVQQHRGVLVLGTSETGNHLRGENYWAMLNRDRTVKPYFSVLGGAGRCSYIWFPALLANERSLQGLTMLYYLNPTYWRDDLNRFLFHYYDRYNSAAAVRAVLPEARRHGLMPFITPYLKQNRQSELPPQGYARRLNDFKSYYTYDLKLLLQGSPLRKHRSYRHPSAEELWMWRHELDPRYNVSADFLAQNPGAGIPAVGDSDFQYRALRAFVKLAKATGIRLTVFIGPYNGILAQRNSPQVIPGYQRLIANIKQILTESGTPYIDGTDLSYCKGVFMDAQHHSAFGAWKIEQKIVARYPKAG